MANDAFFEESGSYLYGGHLGPKPEFASKAASHDLKGASHYLRHFLDLKDEYASDDHSTHGFIRVPMQAVLDYRGYRITAMPFLPLKELVYGSSDGGENLKSSDNLTNELMKRCAESLHLAGHGVCDFADSEIFSAVCMRVVWCGVVRCGMCSLTPLIAIHVG